MEQFLRIARKTWRENILFSVLVELTYRCNLDCFYCYNDANLAGTPLSRAQYETFFDDLAAMRVMNLALTGGEPLAHPDFFPLGARARALGFMVRVKSNGHALSQRLARRLKDEVDPFVVDVSLHGAKAATHDRQTRVEGSFDRLMRNLDTMAELGLRVKLNATLTAWNEAEVAPMFALADARGLPLTFETVVSPRDDGDAEPQTIAASRAGVLAYLRLEAARRGRPPGGESTVPRDEPPLGKNCGTGSSTLTVDPHGNVYPCVQLRWPVGNLHQQSVQEIWSGSPVLGRVRKLAEDAKTMVDGHGSWGREMGFCPGLAWVKTGDPLAVYSEAAQRMELARQVEGPAPAVNEVLDPSGDDGVTSSSFRGEST